MLNPVTCFVMHMALPLRVCMQAMEKERLEILEPDFGNVRKMAFSLPTWLGILSDKM